MLRISCVTYAKQNASCTSGAQVHKCTLHQEGLPCSTLCQPLLQVSALASEYQGRHAGDCVHRTLQLLPVRVVWLLLSLELPPAVWRPAREVLGIRRKRQSGGLNHCFDRLLPQEASRLLGPGTASAAQRPAQQRAAAGTARQGYPLSFHPARCCPALSLEGQH